MSPRWGSSALVLWLAAALAAPVAADVTTRGTEFWACHLENEEAALWAPFGICIANQGSQNALVRIEGHTGDLTTSLVVPGRVQTVVMPNNREVIGSTVKPFAYHVVSDQPVRVFQFDPVLNSRSDDASMLIPAGAMGATYRIVSRAASLGVTGQLHPSYFAVVSTSLDPTTVTIVPTANIAADPDGRIPATPAGTPVVLVLSRFEVAQVQSEGSGQDFTGTLVTADRPIAVFGGHRCANVPEGIGYCDHLEEQLFPVGALGKDFIAAKAFPRGSEPDYWRISAIEDRTRVTLDPDVVGAPITVDAGGFFEFATTEDVHVVADKPIQLAQFFVGRLFDAQLGVGDPSMILTVPNEQLDNDFLFITPANYASDHVTIVAPVGADVALDGSLVPPAALVPVASSGYARARLDVEDGVHRVTCQLGAAVYVYGYDLDVSYGYSAGARAESIAAQIYCDAGGPYSGCAGGGVVQLDGTRSNGPGPLSYLWSAQTPGLTIVDPTAVTTDALLSGSGPYSVSLTVSNLLGSSTCTATIPPTTGLPPVLSCPPEITVSPSELRGAWVNVLANATDDCDPNPIVTNDRTTGGEDASDLYPCGVTWVTFTAEDSGGQTAQCQTIVSVQGIDRPADVAATPDVEPLRVRKAPGGLLALSFEDRRGPAEAYNLYEGTIRPDGIVAYDYVPIRCGEIPTPVRVGVAAFFANGDAGRSHYYLVTASNCFQEGSKGTRSDGMPRPDYPNGCGPIR